MVKEIIVASRTGKTFFLWYSGLRGNKKASKVDYLCSISLLLLAMESRAFADSGSV